MSMRTLRNGAWPIWLALLLAAAMPALAQQFDGLPRSIQQDVVETKLLPAGHYTDVHDWDACGSEAGRKDGKQAADPDAASGFAFEAMVGRNRVEDHLVFGPYIEEPEGDYVVFYRIKLLSDAGEDIVASLDAAAQYGQSILRNRDLTGSQLANGRYVWAPLAFHHPGGKLECRLAWTGYASLRVDRMALYRLEGAALNLAQERAPEAVPSGNPRNLVLQPRHREPRPFPGLFPRSARPSPHLLVIDLRGMSPDLQLMYLTLQGVVNRTLPEIYCLYNPTDAQWLGWMKRRHWIRDAKAVKDPTLLLERYRSRFKGIIVYDPALPATKNVATMLAGVKSGIVVSPRLALQAGPHKIPVLIDLRRRWKTSVEAYRWAFDNLWPKMCHHVIACSWPDHLALRDYLVENRIFIFWISGALDGVKPYANPTAEARLMEQLLARMPVNMPVMSYPWAGKDVGIGEGPGVTLFAEFGKYLVGSIDCANLSVHSGIRVPVFRQKLAPPLPPQDRSKVYASWIISDGDNLPVLTNGNFPQFWADRTRGSVALGWTMSPSAGMLIPDIVDFYYTTATPKDCFLGAVSGIGYTYPDSYGKRFVPAQKSAIFDGFLAQTREHMASMDQKMLWPMNVTRPELIARYAQRIPELKALFPDYGRRVSGYEDATYPTARNVPVFHALTNWSDTLTREQQIDSVTAQIRAVTPSERPAYMHLFVLNWFADLPMLKEVTRRLGPDYRIVRPDQLTAYYSQEMARERVLVRVPRTIAAIIGQPVRWTALLQNGADRPIVAHVKVTAGMERAVCTPESVRLVPGRPVEIRIEGVPTGRSVTLEARGAFKTKRRAVALCALHPEEIAGDVPRISALRLVRQYEGVELQHRVGRDEADPDALARTKRVWAMRPGVSDAGYAIFGPYMPVPAGRYIALFRVKRIGPASGEIATIDACVGGGTPSLIERRLTADDLPDGQYRAFPLVFNHPGGQVETRVNWTGSATLLVDTIILWQALDGHGR
jgi:hypothetical protein